MKRFLCGVTLAALAIMPARAATEIINLTDSNLSLAIPGGSPWGSVMITEDAGALDFTVHLNDGLFFYSAAPSFGFELDKAGATVGAVAFTGGAGASNIVDGGTITGFGSFNYGVTCPTCAVFGPPQASQVTFTVSHPTGLTLGDVTNNQSGFAAAAQAWVYLVADICPVAVEGTAGGAAPVVGVPEPSTWAMMLLGFAGLAYAFRKRFRPHAVA